MKLSYETPNYRMIKVCHVPATNTMESRIKIFETNRYNDTKTESKMFGYDYEIGDVQEQAFTILQRNGFNPVCRASEAGYYVILCNNWGEDFKSVKDLK